MKTNPNDAAFARPCGESPDRYNRGTYGLNKLEYFSGLALQGLLAKGDIDLKCRFESTVIEAVNHAIGLIDELNKKQEEIK